MELLRGSNTRETARSILEDLPILIFVDNVAEKANNSHYQYDDNGSLNCQYHKR